MFIYLYLLLIKNKLAFGWEPAVKFVSLGMIKDKKIQEGDYTYIPDYNFYSRLETISTLQNLLDRGLIDEYLFDTLKVYQKSFLKEYYTPQEISQYYKQKLDLRKNK